MDSMKKVLYGDRRIRITGEEVPIVEELVDEKLPQLLEERRDLEMTFRYVHRWAAQEVEAVEWDESEGVAWGHWLSF
jgi:hypothetical protein